MGCLSAPVRSGVGEAHAAHAHLPELLWTSVIEAKFCSLAVGDSSLKNNFSTTNTPQCDIKLPAV